MRSVRSVYESVYDDGDSFVGVADLEPGLCDQERYLRVYLLLKYPGYYREIDSASFGSQSETIDYLHGCVRKLRNVQSNADNCELLNIYNVCDCDSFVGSTTRECSAIDMHKMLLTHMYLYLPDMYKSAMYDSIERVQQIIAAYM